MTEPHKRFRQWVTVLTALFLALVVLGVFLTGCQSGYQPPGQGVWLGVPSPERGQ